MLFRRAQSHGEMRPCTQKIFCAAENYSYRGHTVPNRISRGMLRLRIVSNVFLNRNRKSSAGRRIRETAREEDHFKKSLVFKKRVKKSAHKAG